MMYWIVGIVLALIFSVLILSYICYRMAFKIPKKYRLEPEQMIRGEEYEQRRETIVGLVAAARAIPFEEVAITSRDGKRLYARYYETRPGAPVQIMFHGYRSHPLLDFSGGLRFGLDCGFNVLLVDQRAHGKSEGRSLAFGVLERLDCLDWVKYTVGRCGEDVKIVLTGISMGASTVMMASDLDMPKNVKGIIADCGYTSAKEIMMKVMGEIGYPPRLAYPFVKLGAILYGGFDPDSHTAPRSLANTDIPVLLIHGEGDTFVPCDMSRLNYSACNSKKTILTVPDAPHGLAFMENPEAYKSAVEKFLKEIGI